MWQYELHAYSCYGEKGIKCLHGETNATDNYTFSMVNFLA